MHIKQLKDEINGRLYSYVNKLGFGFNKTNNEFIKSEDGYDLLFYLIYTKWTSCVTVTAYAYIRHKEVEKIYTKLIGGRWKANWTLGNEICKIKNSPDGRKEVNEDCTICIESNQDITNAIKVLQDFFNSIALPFYENYTKLSQIDLLYNEPPFEEMPVLVQRTLGDQCMKGLIVAKLIKRKNYDELVAIFDRLILIPENNSVRIEYALVKDYLAQI